MRAITPTLLTYIITACSFLIFQLAFTLGKIESYQHDKSHAIAAIEKQVAGDLDKLPLPNSQLYIMGRPSEVDAYIEKLNNTIKSKNFPVSVLELTPNEQPTSTEGIILRELSGQGQSVWLVLLDNDIPFSLFLSLYPLLASLVVYIFCLQYQKTTQEPEQISEADENEVLAWLQIDLKQKKLINLTNQNSVDVANKPLCFFSALVDYCQQNPELSLNPNKELPEELIALSNKYFFRLIDLGHTIRKRPNFTNNLEKTLSEIRAALDEIFEKDFDKKELFYPPKAIGEGSRSKAHSFALSKLDMTRLEYIGK